MTTRVLYCPILLVFLAFCVSSVLCHDDDNNRNNSEKIAKHLQAIASQPQSSTTASRTLKEQQRKVGLHFFIVGYPKTGTSAMMSYLDSRNELKIVKRVDTGSDNDPPEFPMAIEEDVDFLFDRIEEEYVKSDKDQKYGIKWPGAISGKGIGVESIKRIGEYNPLGNEIKIIVGLRHPVRWFESFYNYRSKHLVPPPTTSLIGSNDFHGVCTDTARFEKGIMQLGKIPLRAQDEQFFENHENYNLISGSGGLKVFLYLEEQLSDHDKERHGLFMKELSSYLEVKESFSVDDHFPETNVDSNPDVDICGVEHVAVRRELVRNGRKTANWIRANIVEAEDFVLPNKEHFMSIVDTFGTDPCDDGAESTS